MRVATLFIVLLFATLPGAATGREWNAFSQCGPANIPSHLSEQERGWFRDRFCDQRELAAIHRDFAAMPLRFAARGDRAVRVIIMEGRHYVDGIGHYVIMVDMIERSSGVELLVRAVAPHQSRARIQTELPAEAWNDVVQAASVIGSAPGVQPESRATDEIWFHPMQVVVETSGFGPLRTLYTTIADRGAALEFSALVIDRTWAALPQCHGAEASAPSPWAIEACVQAD